MRRLTRCLVGVAAALALAATPAVTGPPAAGDEFANPDGDGGIDYGIVINPSTQDSPPSDGSDGNDGSDDSGGYTPTDPGGQPDPLTPAEKLEIDSRQTLCLVPLQNFSWCDAPPEQAPQATPQQEEEPPPPVNPADLGQMALDNMPLPAPNISIAPAPPRPTLVRLWTWFWVPSDQWQSQSDSVSVRGTTVTVTIEPESVVWETGEGTTTCDGPGEPWSAGSDAETSSCGHEYEHTTVDEPGGKHTVTATISWHASWTCSGVCLAEEGDLGTLDSESSSARVEVRQRQSLVIE